MTDINLEPYILEQDGWTTIDYAGILAEMTGTNAADWREIDGPESGVGVDDWYRHDRTGLTAYVNNDQGDLSISIADADGDTVEALNAASVPAADPLGP